MKVHNNIENFDLLPGICLKEAEEERVYTLLSKVVPDLADRCSSKMRTRVYFNKNIKGRQDGSGEISTHDDIFVAALYSVLIDDCYVFGYVLNLMREEIQRRDLPIDLYDRISDAAVRCSQAFDFDEIREKAKSIQNLYMRVLYIEEKRAEYLTLNKDEFEGDEYDDLVRPLDDNLSCLLAASQRMLAFAEQHAHTYALESEEPAATDLEILENSEIPLEKNSKKTRATVKKPAASKSNSKTPLQFSGKSTPRIQKKILNYLHKHVGYNPGVDELKYVAAAMDSGYLLRPAFRFFCQEFPAYEAKKSTYGACLGSTGILLKEKRSNKHRDEVAALLKELQTKLK